MTIKIIRILIIWLQLSLVILLAGDLKIHFLKATGDAVLIQTPGGKTMLVDAPGIATDIANIKSYLNALGISTIDIVYNTHAHMDHIGGMLGASGIFANFNVLQFYGLDDSLTAGYFNDNILPYSINPSVPYNTLYQGDIIALDDELEIVVLWPKPGYVVDYSRYNDQSAAFLITYKTNNKKILYMADVMAQGSKALVNDTDQINGKLVNSYLKCDVLKYGHHGQQNTNNNNGDDNNYKNSFLPASQPMFGIATTGWMGPTKGTFNGRDSDWIASLTNTQRQIYDYTWEIPTGLKSFYGAKNGDIVMTCTPQGVISFSCSSNNLYQTPLVSVTPGSISTNTPFTARLDLSPLTWEWYTNEIRGLWSTNAGVTWTEFKFPGTDLTINKTTTLLSYARDNYGNASAANSTVYTLDNTAPVLVWCSPSNNQTEVSPKSSISLIFSEAMKGTLADALSVTNSAGIISGTWALINASNAVFTPASSLGSGNQQIYISISASAQDLFNNAIAATNFNFTISAVTPGTSPVVVITRPADGTIINNGGIISGTASDANGNIAAVEYTWNNWNTFLTAKGNAEWSFNAAFLPEGTNTITVRAWNDLGIPGDGKSITVYVDRTPPVVQVPAEIGTNSYFEKATNIVISVTDINMDKLYYRYGEQEFIAVGSAETLTLCFTNSGEYRIRIKARDLAGNERILDLHYVFDIILINTDGMSARLKTFVKKIKDTDTASVVSGIKERENGINVLEYMVSTSQDKKSTAATIVSRSNDKVLVILRHENGVLSSVPKSITVYDKTGKIIRRIDPAEIRGAVVAWDKTDTRGSKVKDGIYFLTVDYGGGKDRIPVVIMQTGR